MKLGVAAAAHTLKVTYELVFPARLEAKQEIGRASCRERV